jgi:hypothetical protein
MKRLKQLLTNESWTAEKVTFDAGYNNERMVAWLYLPKGFKPPYQPVLFFPGSNEIIQKLMTLHLLTGLWILF